MALSYTAASPRKCSLVGQKTVQAKLSTALRRKAKKEGLGVLCCNGIALVLPAKNIRGKIYWWPCKTLDMQKAEEHSETASGANQ